MKVHSTVRWLTACFLVGIAMSKQTSSESITHAPFGTLASGRAVELYTLRNRHGMEARIATYGGIVVSLSAPDREGRFADVVLGFDTLGEYEKDSPYFGALIGRYGNRIAHGQFKLDSHTYTLATNDGPNSLHGGKVGFDKVVWTVAHASVSKQGPELALTYLSHDGEEGYPGNLAVTAVYTLTEDNALRIDYSATTDQDTVVNLTHHSYFNLRGQGDVLGYVVQIHADRFTPVDSTLIPTGELRSVQGTPFDFRSPKSIGDRITDPDEQLKFAKGYDHNWVLNPPPGGKSVPPSVQVNATVWDQESGRVMQVSSSEPGLQFYTGNFLNGSLKGKGGRTYEFRSGFCMEPQHFPDSPNHPSFPSTVLKPGQTYRSTLIYRFGTR